MAIVGKRVDLKKFHYALEQANKLKISGFTINQAKTSTIEAGFGFFNPYHAIALYKHTCTMFLYLFHFVFLVLDCSMYSVQLKLL